MERKIRRLFDLDSVTSTAVPSSDVLTARVRVQNRSRPLESAQRVTLPMEPTPPALSPVHSRSCRTKACRTKTEKTRRVEIIKFKQFSSRNFNRIAI